MRIWYLWSYLLQLTDSYRLSYILFSTSTEYMKVTFITKKHYILFHCAQRYMPKQSWLAFHLRKHGFHNSYPFSYQCLLIEIFLLYRPNFGLAAIIVTKIVFYKSVFIYRYSLLFNIKHFSTRKPKFSTYGHHCISRSSFDVDVYLIEILVLKHILIY